MYARSVRTYAFSPLLRQYNSQDVTINHDLTSFNKRKNFGFERDARRIAVCLLIISGVCKESESAKSTSSWKTLGAMRRESWWASDSSTVHYQKWKECTASTRKHSSTLETFNFEYTERYLNTEYTYCTSLCASIKKSTSRCRSEQRWYNITSSRTDQISYSRKEEKTEEDYDKRDSRGPSFYAAKGTFPLSRASIVSYRPIEAYWSKQEL
jgi:hypothetical protein